jgi:toxin YoeB
MWKIAYTSTALKQFFLLRKNAKNDYTKCFDLILNIAEDPYAGIGKPEQLKYQNKQEETWSRRINEKDRLVYSIFKEDETVVIQSCLGHYDDK